jgi:hypothetical protein
VKEVVVVEAIGVQAGGGMVSRRPSHAARGKGQATGRQTNKAATKSKKPLWRRAPAAWFGGLVTVILGGALANILSSQAQQQIPSLSPSESLAASPSMPLRPLPESHSPASSRPTQTREAGPPLTVISEDPIDPGDIGGVWMFSGKFALSSSQLKALNDMKSIYDKDNWFFAHGGYEPNTDTQLVVQNNRNYLVRIIDMRVIKACAAPLSGTLFYAPDQGGDAEIRLGFNLDSADTEAESAAGWDSSQWKPDYFANYTVSIQPGSQQVFNLRAVVKEHSCTFNYQLTVLDGTKKVHQTISDGGQPFRVSAPMRDNSGAARFSGYQVVYTGGVYNANGNGAYVRVNPDTFNG